MSATFENGSLEWGVNSDNDQVILSFPAIGIVSVHLASGTHTACCLRGGTVYLIPKTNSENRLEPIAVILRPVDDETEPSTQYLQGFTAGNMAVGGLETRSNESNELAVLIYSLGGGILQVSSCTLLTQPEEYYVLHELVENGTIQLLRELLCSLEDDDPLFSSKSSSWRQARDELKKAASEGNVELNSPMYTSTREVLMELAERKDGVSL